MKEKTLRFGESRGLSGVLTLPEERDESAPGVVFINSGILHHVGPSRLYVRLARRLAEDGHLGFRFDFSGIGDSASRSDTLPFVESAPLEVQAAMDLLQKKFGIDRWILIGLCSGADMAYKVSILDERVVATVKLDPYAYRTRGYYLKRYGPKLLNPMAYLNSYRGRKRNAEIARQRAESDESYTPPEYRRIFPPREEVEENLRKLVDRGVHMLNIFTDGQPEHINHGGQYAAAFPSIDFGELLTVSYMNHAAHTLTDLNDQAAVENLVAEWAARFRGGPKAGVAAA